MSFISMFEYLEGYIVPLCQASKGYGCDNYLPGQYSPALGGIIIMVQSALLVRAECVRQRNEVAIKLCIISLSLFSSLSPVIC